MDAKKFTVNGTYQESGAQKKFTKEINAKNEGFAKEKALATIGSKHGVKRHHVTVESVSETKEESK